MSSLRWPGSNGSARLKRLQLCSEMYSETQQRNLPSRKLTRPIGGIGGSITSMPYIYIRRDRGGGASERRFWGSEASFCETSFFRIEAAAAEGDRWGSAVFCVGIDVVGWCAYALVYLSLDVPFFSFIWRCLGCQFDVLEVKEASGCRCCRILSSSLLE